MRFTLSPYSPECLGAIDAVHDKFVNQSGGHHLVCLLLYLALRLRGGYSRFSLDITCLWNLRPAHISFNEYVAQTSRVIPVVVLERLDEKGGAPRG